MNAKTLLTRLNSMGVMLTAHTPGKLKIDAPKGAISPSLRAALSQYKQELIALLDTKSTVRNELNELNEFNRRRAAKTGHRRAWRPFPDWLTCLAAAGDPIPAQQFFTALCLDYGHPSEEIAERLRLVVPHHLRQPVKPLIRPEWAAKYIAAHPFRWELETNTTAFNTLKGQIAA